LNALQAERGYSDLADGFQGGDFGDGLNGGKQRRRRRKKGPSDQDDFLLDLDPDGRGGEGGLEGDVEWESAYKDDDVWARRGGGGGGWEEAEAEAEAIEEVDKPSEHFLCRPGFVTLRSNTSMSTSLSIVC
jgi:hypothetical protein